MTSVVSDHTVDDGAARKLGNTLRVSTDDVAEECRAAHLDEQGVEQPRPLQRMSESERCHMRADALIALSLAAILRDERLAYSDLAADWRLRAEEAARHQPKSC